jgi:hypothetical protein
MLNSPQQLITKRTGDWWKDDRRNWCAYCGIAISATPVGKTVRKATRDHVVSRVHRGKAVTVPACQPCNQAKGNHALADFLLSPYLGAARAKKRPNQWSMSTLWLAMALASVEQARSLSADWPSD